MVVEVVVSDGSLVGAAVVDEDFTVVVVPPASARPCEHAATITARKAMLRADHRRSVTLGPIRFMEEVQG